jgi:hypothetical protein
MMPTQMLPTETRTPQLSREAIETLETLSRRVQPPIVAERVWTRFFSDSDRACLGNDLPSCWMTYGTIGMWLRAKTVSWPRALIELSEALGWLNASNRDWLLGETGESVPAPSLPAWNAATGELTLDGRVVRIVARRASNIRRILSAFQEEGWPPRIDDPRPGGENGPRLHRAIAMLNCELEDISFHSDGHTRGVTWRHC